MTALPGSLQFVAVLCAIWNGIRRRSGLLFAFGRRCGLFLGGATDKKERKD